MRILDRLPIEEEPTVLFVGAEAVTIKRYQIGVWISINDETRPFPAVLDLGHSHTRSGRKNLKIGLTPGCPGLPGLPRVAADPGLPRVAGLPDPGLPGLP